ncbi:response regulator [Spirochaetia bacterium 38H-sp]|uniref:Response regulator n=1 Tax=Rarispira pelagica TaxID=3141764 RepID=A0ABU9UE86_9SPIR
MKAHVLVVDDEPDIRELVAFNLEREGYRVSTAEDGNTALQIVRSELPDVVVLDLMLPGKDGLEVCRDLKADKATTNIPIIMLTAKAEEADIVIGLELGADDYVTKPFSPRVLLARIKAVLKRVKTEKTDVTGLVSIGILSIDPLKHRAEVEGKAVELSATEFDILYFLARNPGWVFSRAQIIDAVRGNNYAVTERSVDVQILSIRKKLGKARDYIRTIRGVGYKFET